MANKVLSHPSWVCGLKQPMIDNSNFRSQVTPFVGVWIETSMKTAIQQR